MYVDAIDQHPSARWFFSSIQDIEQGRFSRAAGSHQADKLTTLFGDIHVLQSRPATAEMVKQVIRRKSNMRPAFTREKFANDIAVIDGFYFVTAYGAPGRKNIHPPALQQLTVEIQRCYAEVFDEISLRIR